MADSARLGRRLSSEGVGSCFLFACVIGSGIMAADLSAGNDAIALLGNTAATAAILFVLIVMLGPISGAHMNPAVTLVAASRGRLPWREASLMCRVRGAPRRRPDRVAAAIMAANRPHPVLIICFLLLHECAPVACET